ncbi:MAG: CRISPR-associated helicase Cas3' [Campylobacterales bacterium]|nr:CRISPR-associated helicase Cas3' [Campylobacterales bacterium]
MRLRLIAHTDEQGNTHDLAEHLQKSAAMAAHFASLFQSDEWAYAATLWYDLGKYSDAFQAKIAPDAHIEERNGRVNHSSAGALYALKQLGDSGKLLAYLIAGHHAGLSDFDSADAGAASLHVRLQNDTSYLDDALKNADTSVIALSKTPSQKPLGGAEGLHLWLRMLYSCLVDADFLDTEAFMDSKRSQTRSAAVERSAMLEVFERHMQQFAQKEGVINQLRREILSECQSAAKLNKRLFSLTVPTGGGKTLSSLAFALYHAQHFDKRRIIYAIPYTSIIEQTGTIFSQIFESLEGSVLEHHSNLDPSKETPQSRLVCENWDAPLIVTTTVQLFESLFAAKSSQCRKLHNIVNSVIILDEAQLLPPELLGPILQSIRLLSTHYGVTVLLCTATQPELGSRSNSHPNGKLVGLDEVHEVISNPKVLYDQLKRVEVSIDDPKSPKSWEEIAQEISAHPKVLAIVNTRADASTLFRLMPKGSIHLSALMCPQHRSDTIALIKERLQSDEPIRVVSTQLIEAGVDIDFPVVYRALAGLDSIAQAAGRCNREGRLKSFGNVKVFIPPKPAPSGLLRFGEQAMKSMMVNPPDEWLDPSSFARYFDTYYAQMHNFDKQAIIKNMLTPDQRHLALQFRSAAQAFKMIDDGGSQSIIVRYDDTAESLLDRLRFAGVSRDLMRRLGRYSVSLARYHFEALQKRGDLEEIEGVFVLRPTLYDKALGVVVADSAITPESLWC